MSFLPPVRSSSCTNHPNHHCHRPVAVYMLLLLTTISTHLLLVVVVQGFSPPVLPLPHHGGRSMVVHGSSSGRCHPIHLLLPPATDVWVYPTEVDVNDAVHTIVRDAATLAIAQRGHFTMAIPGGSILKVLSTMDVVSNTSTSTSDSNWISQTTLAYVNHKCVPNDDLDRAIHAKARKLFLDQWGLPNENVIMLNDDDATTTTPEIVAVDYENQLKALPESILPRDPITGFPIFDLMLIGVGDDGHIGSLYPNQPHVNELNRWVVGVTKADGGPGSISLTVPLMQYPTMSVVVAAGKSDKYPQGKANAMKKAIYDGHVTPSTFPACALRQSAIWILDEPNASELPKEQDKDEDDEGENGLMTFRTDRNYRERTVLMTTPAQPASN